MIDLTKYTWLKPHLPLPETLEEQEDFQDILKAIEKKESNLGLRNLYANYYLDQLQKAKEEGRKVSAVRYRNRYYRYFDPFLSSSYSGTGICCEFQYRCDCRSHCDGLLLSEYEDENATDQKLYTGTRLSVHGYCQFCDVHFIKDVASSCF